MTKKRRVAMWCAVSAVLALLLAGCLIFMVQPTRVVFDKQLSFSFSVQMEFLDNRDPDFDVVVHDGAFMSETFELQWVDPAVVLRLIAVSASGSDLVLVIDRKNLQDVYVVYDRKTRMVQPWTAESNLLERFEGESGVKGLKMVGKS